MKASRIANLLLILNLLIVAFFSIEISCYMNNGGVSLITGVLIIASVAYLPVIFLVATLIHFLSKAKSKTTLILLIITLVVNVFWMTWEIKYISDAESGDGESTEDMQMIDSINISDSLNTTDSLSNPH